MFEEEKVVSYTNIKPTNIHTLVTCNCCLKELFLPDLTNAKISFVDLNEWIRLIIDSVVKYPIQVLYFIDSVIALVLQPGTMHLSLCLYKVNDNLCIVPV